MNQVPVLPGDEWLPQGAGWNFVQLATGAGYWLRAGDTRELGTGALLVLTSLAAGTFRASQLGPVRLNVFRVEPDRLTGLVTLGEQLFLRSALAREAFSFRVFPPMDPLADRCQKLCLESDGGQLRSRVQMLQIFVDFLGNDLKAPRAEPTAPPDAKRRLTELLKQTPAAQLLERSLAELVADTHCTPRHLSRVFHQLTGMSFREKKAELRLSKASRS